MFSEHMVYNVPELPVLEEGFSEFEENCPGTGGLHESELRDGFPLSSEQCGSSPSLSLLVLVNIWQQQGFILCESIFLRCSRSIESFEGRVHELGLLKTQPFTWRRQQAGRHLDTEEAINGLLLQDHQKVKFLSRYMGFREHRFVVAAEICSFGVEDLQHVQAAGGFHRSEVAFEPG